MISFKSYINPEERRKADRKLPKLMVEGLLLGGSGLGVLALIFEIAADAFSVAAYQTLLAIHGAEGHHEVAILAFTTLSVMLFLGIVPAYKAGAYLRPNAGGSGPLVEAIGPPRMRWLSWVGTSLFFIDAILTIIISSISAADVTMLVFPELAEYRIVLAEFYAFFIMSVLVAVGPKRAVPLFLLGGAAFTLFTIVALTTVGATAAGNPEWSFLTQGIVHRLEEQGVIEHVVRAQQDFSAIGTVVFFQLFFRSMSSAMLGFSGYEVIPASGKHAAPPKWKVINTALTFAAVFLIGTGILQLYAAQQWRIPATEGYSTLLIEYEVFAVQALGTGVNEDDIVVTDAHREQAALVLEERLEHEALDIESEESIPVGPERDAEIEAIAEDIAFASAIERAIGGTSGESVLFVAAILLAIILLLAQGGGYVGGAAVAANAARLGRLPRFFLEDRIGIVVIWGFAAILIPIIREVVIVESYYAFGFVSAFIITSTTVFFSRDEVLKDRGIEPGSSEAKSLRFAGLRGMIASYSMGIVLITQKTDALTAIVIFGGILTVLQLAYARGGLRVEPERLKPRDRFPGTQPRYLSGIQRAQDEARQRGVATLVNELITGGALVKFNVEPQRIRRLVCYIHNIRPEYFHVPDNGHDEYEHDPEPSVELDVIYQRCFTQKEEIVADIEFYSHYGIFTFIDKYYHNWVNYEHGRDPATVQQAMIGILFPMSDPKRIWEEYQQYEWLKQPEPIWQFCRERYQWAKDQWPNLSDRITTVWTLQELGLIPDEVDVDTIIKVGERDKLKRVQIHTHGVGGELRPSEHVDYDPDVEAEKLTNDPADHHDNPSEDGYNESE